MINANKDKLASFFQGSSQFVVPFFQRSYVWDEDNWNTLWDHVATILEGCEGNVPKEHFIGTIITKQQPAQSIGESRYDLIDGQQRLTTIAIFLRAISEASVGQMSNLKGQILGDLRFQDARGKFYSRIEPSSYDKQHFDAILDGKTPAGEHRIIRAYNFFLEKLSGFPDEKLNLLRLVILNNVPVISMMLSSEDDEQDIFDTINALGVRLTTGELLKNYIFKAKDLQNQYGRLWKNIYEGNDEQIEFWNEEKTAGRVIRTNIEVMLYCYLVIKTGREIQLESLFKEYKDWLADKTIADRVEFLRELSQYAEIYYSFPTGNDLNQIGFIEEEKRFFHVIENLMVTTVYPLVLNVYKDVESQQIRADILRLLESFIVRRNVCRLTTKNYNLLFIQILKEIKKRQTGLDLQILTDILRGFSDPSTRMPSDAEFYKAFKLEVLSNQNAREILFLLALVDVSTGLADVTRLSVANYSVEHIMPVQWETNWSDRDMNAEEKADRDRKLKTLGNLTLVTKRLNSSMQNAAWSQKKQSLKRNSSLRMTVDWLEKDMWDEAAIDERAERLAKTAQKIWKGIDLEQ